MKSMKVLRDSMYTYTTVLYDDSVVYASLPQTFRRVGPHGPSDSQVWQRRHCSDRVPRRDRVAP